MPRLRPFILCLALAGFACGSASASTFFDSQASFAAAAGATPSYGFEGIAPSGSWTSGPVTVAGVSFDSPGSAFTIDVLSNPTYGASFFSGQTTDVSPSSVVVTLAGTNAIGFSYGGYYTLPGTAVTFTLSTGEVFSDTMPDSAATKFAGFVSSAPITSVKLSTIDNSDPNQYAYTMDVVQFTVAAVVPEASSSAMLLAGLGVLAFGAGQRRRRQ